MSKKYLFTPAGKESWEYAKRYSKRHFPKETKPYFQDILNVIKNISENPQQYSYRDDLASNTGLKIYGVREHYIIFEILSDKRIVIVGFEKKERDIEMILKKRSAEIIRELSYYLRK